jgi:hypothetical protein
MDPKAQKYKNTGVDRKIGFEIYEYSIGSVAPRVSVERSERGKIY